MKKEIAEAWIKDLRTNPPQADGALCDGKGHCCLGRLAVVLGCKFKFDEGEDGYVPVLKGRILKASSVLPWKLRQLSGLKTDNGALNDGDVDFVLAEMNDKGVPFRKIADLIEKHWEAL